MQHAPALIVAPCTGVEANVYDTEISADLGRPVPRCERPEDGDGMVVVSVLSRAGAAIVCNRHQSKERT